MWGDAKNLKDIYPFRVPLIGNNIVITKAIFFLLTFPPLSGKHLDRYSHGKRTYPEDGIPHVQKKNNGAPSMCLYIWSRIESELCAR